MPGTKVVKLQESGFYSSSSHLRYRGGLPRNLKDFTLCVRLNLNFLRGDQRSYWLSVGNTTHPDLLTGAFESGHSSGPRVVMTRHHPEVEDEAAVEVGHGFDFQAWHHYCFVFSSYPEQPFPGGRVNLTNKAYMDGIFISEGIIGVVYHLPTEVPAKVPKDLRNF